jgi:hypothetical protein
MTKWERECATAVALAVVTPGGVPPAGANSLKQERSATVPTVDADAKTFGCHWRVCDLTYKVTNSTAFRVGKKNASFDDLKAGESVRVTYHLVDKDWSLTGRHQRALIGVGRSLRRLDWNHAVQAATALEGTLPSFQQRGRSAVGDQAVFFGGRLCAFGNSPMTWITSKRVYDLDGRQAADT